MTGKSNYPRLYVPHSMNELLSLKKSIPSIGVFAGGTWIYGHQNKKYPEIDDAILIKDIQELRRISRTERYLDIGAGASINRILNTGQHVLPESIRLAFESIGSFPVRNRATLGGNLAVSSYRLNTFPVLLLFDTRIELRKSGGARWVPLHWLFNPKGDPVPAPDEIITRIRIPLSTWNSQFFYRNREPFTDRKNYLVCCCIANSQKGVLNDLRFAIQTALPEPIRFKDVEVNLEGKKLPLTGKDRNWIISVVQNSENFSRVAPFIQYKSLGLLDRFLSSLIPDI